MFSKTSIQSLVYYLSDVFMFPTDVLKKFTVKIKCKNVFFNKM